MQIEPIKVLEKEEQCHCTSILSRIVYGYKYFNN